MDSLSCLPSELLFEIHRRCSSFSCLWSLLNTSSRLRSVFNERANDIVHTVLNSTNPVQTRVRMRIVLAMQTRSLSAQRYESIESTQSAQWILSESLVASPEQLRQFVRLSHRIHVMAHLCIAECLENCLASPISPREIPLNLEGPSWTEENRVLLGLWHVWCLNGLKIAAREGHLRWSEEDIALVQRAGVYRFPAYPNSVYQGITASRWLWRQANPGLSEADFWPDGTPDILPLPRLAHSAEFGWKCQEPSTPAAIEQDWMGCIEYHPPKPNPPPVMVHRPEAQIWSSDSSDDDYEFDSESPSEEDASEDGDSEAEASGSEGSDTDSEAEPLSSEGSDSDSAPSESTQAPPVSSLRVVNRNPPQINAPIRKFQWYAARSRRPPEHGKLEKEWHNLDARTLGWQIWYNMTSDPNAGDAQHMAYNGYIKYGFAIWEERRMIDLGMWSNDAWNNPTRFYWRCYELLSDKDVHCHSWLYQTYDSDSDANSLTRDWAAAGMIYRRIGRRDLR
ncbi:hypothetical protein BJX96DRAFT_144030 [Aspergillus floccosus]